MQTHTHTHRPRIQFTAKIIPMCYTKFTKALTLMRFCCISRLCFIIIPGRIMNECVHPRNISMGLHLKLIRLTFNSILFSWCTARTTPKTVWHCTWIIHGLAKCKIISYAKVQKQTNNQHTNPILFSFYSLFIALGCLLLTPAGVYQYLYTGKILCVCMPFLFAQQQIELYNFLHGLFQYKQWIKSWNKNNRN